VKCANEFASALLFQCFDSLFCQHYVDALKVNARVKIGLPTSNTIAFRLLCGAKTCAMFTRGYVTVDYGYILSAQLADLLGSQLGLHSRL
jgi:hypothetical protein